MADADKAAAAARGRAKLEEFRKKKAAKGAAAAVVQANKAAPLPAAATQPPLEAGATSPERDTAMLLSGTHEAEAHAHALGGVLSLPEVSASSAVASAYAQLSASYYDDVIDDVPFSQPEQAPVARTLGGAPPPEVQQHVSPDVLRGRSVLSWLDAPTDRAPGLATPEAPAATPERGAGGGVVAAPAEAVSHPVEAGRSSSYTMHAAATVRDADSRAGVFTAPRMDPWPAPAAPNPAPSRHDALVAHIEELTRDKLVLQRQLDTALGVTAAASSDHDDVVARFNAQAAKLEAAHAALEYAMSAADAAAAAAAEAERERDVARAAQQVALSRCGALAADAIALEERLVQCRRREVRATSKLGRDRARAQEAVARAKALGAVATRLSVQKRRLMRRLRALASERELAGLPRLPAGFFSLADGEESDGDDEGDADVAALARTSYDTGSDGDNEDDDDAAGERDDTGPHTPAAAHAGSNQVPPNTPAMLNGHGAHAADGLESADGATRDALARIHALLGELEQRQQQQLAGLRTPGTGVRGGGDVAELAAANAALSRRLEKAQRRLEEAGLGSDSDDSDSDTSSDEGGVTDPSPVYNRASVPAGAGWLQGARRRESLAALAAASVTPTKIATGE